MDSVTALYFRQYVDESPFATVLTELSEGRILYANHAAMRMGNEAGLDSLIGQTLVGINFWTHHEWQEAIAHARKAPLESRRVNLLAPDGTPQSELNNTRMLVIDGREYLSTTVVDISQVLEVEHELADARKRLEKAQSIAKMGSFVINLEQRRFDGSAECMRLLGVAGEAAAISLEEMFELFLPEDKIEERTTHDLQTTGRFEIEHRLMHQPNRWVFTRAELDELPDGRRLIRGSVQDITDRKLAEQQREELIRKMQETQRLESLGLMAGGIAHDFNNLLVGILGTADLALLDDELTDSARARLREIVSASQRAADLTRQLLAYSGKGHFVIETNDLTDLVRDITDLLKVSINGNHEVRHFLLDGLPAVECDVTQLQQVIMNLVINASEAIEDGQHGVITLATGVQSLEPDELPDAGPGDELEAGDYVYLEVADNGTGMSEATTQRVFDPFFTTKFTGRGLGMAAVQGILRGHKGAIQLHTRLGKGSSFKVLLPASQNSTQTASDQPPQPERGHRARDRAGD